jgi:hypothetical protein
MVSTRFVCCAVILLMPTNEPASRLSSKLSMTTKRRCPYTNPWDSFEKRGFIAFISTARMHSGSSSLFRNRQTPIPAHIHLTLRYPHTGHDIKVTVQYEFRKTRTMRIGNLLGKPRPIYTFVPSASSFVHFALGLFCCTINDACCNPYSYFIHFVDFPVLCISCRRKTSCLKLCITGRFYFIAYKLFCLR